MAYLFEQLVGILLAVALLYTLFIVPGKCLFLRFPAARKLFPEAGGAELLVSLSVMPILLYLAARVAGWPWGFVLGYPLLIVLLKPFRAKVVFQKLDRATWLMLGGWLALVIVMTIDIPVGNKLYTPAVAFDWSKHVLVVNALAHTGVPPVNPTYYPGHPQPLCYYYLWQLMCSTFVWGWLTPRALVTGGLFWTGIAVFTVFTQFLQRHYPDEKGHVAGRRLLLLLLLLTGNLASLFFVVRLGLCLFNGAPLRFSFFYCLQSGSDPIYGWLNTLLNAPHHAAACATAFTGFLVLRSAAIAPEKNTGIAVLLAGLAFASTAGMSIWVGVAAATIGMAWCLVLMAQRQKNECLLWIMAGVIAALAILPFFLELRQGNDLHGSPLGFQVRGISFTSLLPLPWRSWADFLLLPVNYVIEIGFPLLAALLMWRLRARKTAPSSHELFLRVLFWTSLFIVSFFASIVRHNDFGWRGALFAQAACVLWSWPLFASLFARLSGEPRTLSMDAASRCPRLWNVALLALGIGWLSAVIDPVLLRISNAMLDSPRITVNDTEYTGLGLPDDKKTATRMAAYREGYDWLRSHTPQEARIALNPARSVEVPFYLYADRPVVASDLYNSTLFGLTEEDFLSVARRIAPLFSAPPIAWATLKKTVASFGVDYLVVRSDDPIWNQPSDWPAPVYQNGAMAIYPCAPAP